MAESIRILIVEDLPTDAELAQREIRKTLENCVFHRVETREDFLAALSDFRPDLIVSDYSMPRFDGLTALKLALQHAPSTPLIILTGSMNEDTAVGCMKAGAVDYVIKEYIKRLGQAVVHALEEKQVRLDRQRAERALRESEERFRSLYENAMIGIYRTTPAGQILMVNPAGVHLLGYDSFNELAQRNLEQDTFDLRNSRQEFRERLEAEGSLNGLEGAWRRRDGSIIFVRECARVIRGEDGKPLYYDGTFEDVTAWKQAEHALRESEEMYRSLVATSPTAIVVTDLQNRILISNQPALEIFGYVDNPDVLGRTIYEWVPPEEMESVQEAIADLLARGRLKQFQRTLLRRSGERFLAEVKGALVGDAASSSRQIMFLITDVTERQRAEQSLRESEARYRARTKELEALFALSTHVNEAKTAEDVFPVVLREMTRTLDADACEIKLPDSRGENLIITLSEGSVAAEIGKTEGRDEGFAGIVMRTGEPVVTEDYSSNPNRITDLTYVEQIGPAMVVPLNSENGVLGALAASRKKSQPARPFSSEEVRLLVAMGEIAGSALRRVRLFDDAQRRLRHTQALHDIQLSVASSFDLPITLNIALEHTLTQLGADAAAVFLFDPHTLLLEYAAGLGFRTPNIKHSRLRLNEGPTGRAVLERKVVFIPDVNETGKEFLHKRSISEERFVTYCAVPFISKGQVKGVLEVFHRVPFHVDGEWHALMETLAGQIAIAVDNLMLFSDLQDSNLQLALAYDATIEGLSRALDLRDKETEDHTRRVTEMTVQLARVFGMDETEFVHLRRGALLHDIGKLGIPDAILFKPGPLTDTEWAIMRRHPEFAFEIFSTIEYLRPALDIPYCHHEKWDGTGYPRRLEKAAIPLAARLFAVIDVWDALTSERPYRQAWPQDKAIAYIGEQAGRHFDPHAVESFMKISLP
jgi:PAS domain S-box-containing protein